MSEKTEDQHWQEIQDVLEEYQPRFVEFAKKGNAEAAVAKVNWEKIKRHAQTADEAREIAERVLDPKRTVNVPGIGIISS